MVNNKNKVNYIPNLWRIFSLEVDKLLKRSNKDHKVNFFCCEVLKG